MSYLLHVMLAFGSLAVYELGYAMEAEHPLGLAALVVLPHVAGTLARRLFDRGRFRSGAVLERLLIWFAPLLQYVAVLACGWIPMVERWTGVRASLGTWSGLGTLLGLAPYVLFELTVIEARLRLLRAPAGLRGFQIRLLSSSLLPVVSYLAFGSLVGTSDRLRVHLQTVALFEVGYLVALLVVLALLLPLTLRHVWGTGPIEVPWQRELLEDLARRARFRARAILCWRTGHRMANAAILGVTPGTRIVIFTDALLARLGPQELAAVFAHEMGHARRRHALTFGAFTLGFFLLGDLLSRSLGFESEYLDAGVLLALVVAWYFSFGWLSRRFELEADLEALELLGETRSLASALASVSGAHAADRSSWRHFSTTERLRFLDALETDPSVGARLRRKLRWIARLSLVLFAVTGGWQVVGLGRTLSEDRIVAELRLGEYARAVALAEHVELGEGLRGLVDRVGEGGVSTEIVELEREAQLLLAQGRLGRAWQLVELAELRGAEHLDTVRDELRRRREGGAGSGTPAEVGPRWTAAFERFDRLP